MTPYFQRLLDKDRLCFLDCETSDGNGKGSLNPHDPKSFMALLQFNVDNSGAKLMRPSNGGIAYLKELIEQGYIFVLHNSAFDLYWARVEYGVTIDNVYDTMIASQVLNCGKTLPDVASRMFKKTKEDQSADFDYDDLLKSQIDNKDFVPQNYFDDEDDEGKNFLHNLAATVYRYTESHVELDKEMQLSDWARNPLSAEQVKYAKNDVIYLPEVLEQQLKFIQRHKLERIIELEMKVKPAIIQMKYDGIALEPELWDYYVKESKEIADNLESPLNKEIGLILFKDEEEISYSLFEEPKDFNVRSPGQLAKFLGIEKTSAQAINEFLEFNKDEDRRQLIERIMLFRENYKFYSTYGAGYKKFVGEDGRIHGELLQGKTATGRFASFSPNLQNFDRNIFKYLLKEEHPDYVLISADYSSVESRILAYEAGDELYIDSVNSTDVHAANARKMFKIPDDEPVTAEQRSLAKGISFGVSYGISARGLYNRGLAASLEEGQEFIDNYFGTFVGVAKFLNNSKREAISTGKTQDSYGRIRWYDKPKGLSRKDEGVWQNKVERQAQNHKIQSGSANVTKYAIARLYEYTRTVNAMLSLILTVHDSIVGKSHRDKILTNCRKMLEIMESAGPTIIKGMISPVDLDVGNKLKLTCKVSGVEFSTYEYDFVKKNQTLKKLNLNYHPELKKLIKKHKWYGDMDVVSREFENWVVLHLSNIEKTDITKELSKTLGITEGFLKDVYSTKESR